MPEAVPPAPVHRRGEAPSKLRPWIMLAFACGAFALSGWLAWSFHTEVAGPRSRVQQLRLPPKQAERESGRVHGAATVVPLHPGSLAPCLVSHKPSKNWRHVALHEGTRVRFSDGRVATIAPEAPIDFHDDESPATSPGPEGAKRARARLRDLREDKPWRVYCLGPSEAVYIDGCRGRDSGQVVPCAGEDHVTFALGRSADPLVRQAAGSDVARLAGSLFTWMLGALLCWLLVYASGASVDRLAAHGRGIEAVEPISGWAAVVILGVLMSFSGWASWVGPPITTALLLVFACWIALLAGNRVRDLVAARRVIRSTRTTRLHDRGADVQELAVSVAANAPRIEGLHAGNRPAFVSFVVSEHVTVKRSSGKTASESCEVLRVRHPRQLPVEDASGRGLIDTADALIDVIEDAPLEAIGPVHLPGWLAESGVRMPAPSAAHEKFSIRSNSLDPGEQLLVYGKVQRVRPEGELLEPGAGYRADPTVPVITGKPVVYLGSERELERAISAAIRTLCALGSIHVVMTLGALAGCLFAITR